MQVHARAPKVCRGDVAAWRSRAYARFTKPGARSAFRPAATSYERSLRALDACLANTYGTPHLGNFADASDEFVYIVLSRKTVERAYQEAFQKLRDLGPWDTVAGLPESTIARRIRGGGLERKKARAIKAGFKLIAQTLGTHDLAAARSLSSERLFALLSSLPEVGPKSALCVMLYSFGRPTFPVDAHVGRVLARLGILGPIAPNLSAMNHKQRQRELEDAIPPDLRYRLHVNLIAHGRALCTARRPLCATCPIRHLCVRGQLKLTHRGHRKLTHPPRFAAGASQAATTT